MHRNEKNITIWTEPYNHKTWHDSRRVKYVTSKINLKTLFTMPMAPPPNKLSLHAKQFDGKTKERQCCARFYGGYCSLWPNRTARSLSRAWPSLLRAHNHIGGATAVPLHHKKCLLCSVLIYIVLGHIAPIGFPSETGCLRSFKAFHLLAPYYAAVLPRSHQPRTLQSSSASHNVRSHNLSNHDYCAMRNAATTLRWATR